MSYQIDDYSKTKIFITDGWREWYLPKFRINMEVAEPLLTINWDDAELGSPARRQLVLDYTDVSGYGYANPTSAADLKSIIEAYEVSAWTDIGPGGNLLINKADLLSHDGIGDAILPGGTNEYLLSRDDSTATGLAWISKTVAGGGLWVPIATKTSRLYATSIAEVSGTATTTEELLTTFTITGGDCVDTDTVIVRALVSHSSSSGSQKVWRIRVDTSATGTTGTIVAEFQNNSSTGATIPLKIWQDIKCKANGGNTLETASNNAGAFTLGVLAGVAVANINLANNWYIKITCDKAVVGDTMTFRYGDIEIHKA